MTEHDPIKYDAKSNQLTCRGEWDLDHVPQCQTALNKIKEPDKGEISVDGGEIKKMDSAGAFLLLTWQSKLKKKGVEIKFKNFSEGYQGLISLIQKRTKEKMTLPTVPSFDWITQIGQNTFRQLNEFFSYLTFVGELSKEVLRLIRKPMHYRLKSTANVIYRNGYQALPIIALLSFMIGVVITYQMGLQLRNYGANIYIIDLLGLSILREFGPLLTAIMVAGRTGSSFTAQLGLMKTNQEIDALNTMGITPAELLLLPRITGLFIALPLLTMWADIFGVMGGMVMANNMLSISWYDFMHRFPRVIPLRALLIGLGKAPIFALIIASVGCFQGMRVEGSADSVGRNTTRSVVLSIFFIIVADAIFSVIFSKLKL